jgi:ABC-type multidrug transport system permease subunit
VLVVPAGYGDSLATSPLPLEVVGSGDNPFASGVAESIGGAVAGQVDLRRAVHAAMAEGGLPPPAGDVQPVINSEMVGFTEPFDAQFYFGPLSVFLFLALGTVARSLLRDEHDGMLDRIRSAPVSSWQVLGGSAAGVVVQGACAAGSVVLLSTLVFGAVWGQPIEVAVVLAAFVVAVAGLLGLVVGVAHTEPQAESWTNFLAFGFAIIGGAFFGGSTLPGLLGRIGTLTPNGAAMRALIELGPGEQSLLGVWPHVTWLLLMGVGGLLVGARLLDRRLR